MELTRAALGLPPTRSYRVDDRLAEIAFGEWEGLTYRDVLARDPDVVARRESSKWGFLPPGGESYIDVVERGRRLVRHANHRHCRRPPMAAPERALIARRRRRPAGGGSWHGPIDQGVVYVFAEETLGRWRAMVPCDVKQNV